MSGDRIIKTLAFNKILDKDIIDKINSIDKGKLNDYIKELIRRDINSNDLFSEKEEARIEEIVMKLVKNYNFTEKSQEEKENFKPDPKAAKALNQFL